jgi:methyl-accepting chemotaxis protein
MRKGLEHMDNRELLIELVRTQRRDTFLEHVTAIINLVFLAVMILVLVILVPKPVTTLREVDRTVKEVNTLALEAQESLDGIDVMVGNVDKMVVENTDAVTTALNQINQVDYQKLNEAISSLNATVTPLAEMMKALPFGSRN